MFKPRPDGTFDVQLPADTRLALADLASQLGEVITSDAPQTRRLFPTAYADDPERDAGYQVFARDQLIEQRREAIQLLNDSAQKDVLAERELASWMAVVNDVRLVLGTTLDVSEEDDFIDPDHPDADLYLLYHQLGAILHNIVVALQIALPEPTAPDDPIDL